MKRSTHPLPLAATVAILLLAGPASAATYVWNVATPGANNWNVNANWNPSTGNPGSADTAVFNSAGVSTSPTTVNNIVSVNTTVTGLLYTNVTGYHVTQIPGSVTLTVSGSFTNGGLVGGSTGFSTTNLMTGAGTFYASGNIFHVGNNNTTSGSASALLDVSGLNNFVYNASGGTFNLGNEGSRSLGNLNLAAVSNNITAGTVNINTGATSTGTTGNFNLGPGTNIINATTINLAASRNTTPMQFSGSTGGLRIRGLAGGDADRANMVIANRNTGGSGTITVGSLITSGHQLDAKFGTLTLGQANNSGSTGGPNAVGANGILTFDQGIVDATTITMAICSASNATNQNALATITVGSNSVAGLAGQLIVGTGGISLVNLNPLTVSQGPNSATGAVNVVYGTITSAGSITKASVNGNGTIAISNGILAMASGTVVGSAAVPIDNFNVTNATVQLAVVSGTTNIEAVNFNQSGPLNFIVTALPPPLAYPTNIILARYSTFSGSSASYSVTLPGFYLGSVANDGANNIVLTVTGTSVVSKSDEWGGGVNNIWNSTDLNWTNAAAAVNYNDGDSVTFDDLSSVNNVSLAAAFQPLSVTVTNNVANYTFSGTGSIGGSTMLTKYGSASLTLTESGGDNFTGGIAVSNGAVVLNNVNSAITGGATIASGGSLQIGNNTANGNMPGTVTANGTLNFKRSDNLTIANTISGAGSVTNSGSGVLTLSGNNSYSGGLTANAGSVRLSNTNSAGTGVITVNPGAIAVLATANITNNVTLAGGTLAVGATQNPLKLELTAAASTTSTLLIADPANLGAGDAIEIAFTNTGTWHGSGNVILVTVTNDASADSGNGIRLRGLASSDFSGTLTLSNGVKAELQTIVPGPFSPAGTGKIGLVCGTYLGNNTTSNAVTGVNNTYSEFNLRNLSSGDTVLGNDVMVLGSGITLLDPLGTAPIGAKVTMGNLTVGNGQELGIYLAAGSNPHVIEFPTVSLTGGTVVFSPKTPGFGAANSTGSDFLFGDISQTSPSSIVMNGLRTLTLRGTCTYSGATTISNGILALTNSATIANTTNIQIGAGATFDVSGLSTTFTLGANQKLSGLGATGTLAGNATLSAGSVVLNYTNGTPTLTVTNGTLTLNNNAVTVTVVGTALPVGMYKLVSTNTAGGVVAGSVTSSTLTILGAGVAAGTLTMLTIATNELYLVVNSPITANNVTYNRGSVNSWQIPVVNLLTNASDVHGDILSLTSVGTSTNGVTVTIGGGNVSYLNTNLVNDQFTYTVTDGKGGSATGTVTLVAAPFASGQNGTIAVSGSTATVGFAGIPGYKYEAQRSTNLVDWVTLQTTNAPAGGKFEVTDTFSDLGGVPSTAYYRLMWNGN